MTGVETGRGGADRTVPCVASPASQSPPLRFLLRPLVRDDLARRASEIVHLLLEELPWIGLRLFFFCGAKRRRRRPEPRCVPYLVAGAVHPVAGLDPRGLLSTPMRA